MTFDPHFTHDHGNAKRKGTHDPSLALRLRAGIRRKAARGCNATDRPFSVNGRRQPIILRRV